MTESRTTPAPSNPKPTLDYGPPARRPSPVPLLGVMACAVGILFGVGLLCFGCWQLYYGVAGSAGDQPEHLLQGAAIVLAGVLLIALCAKWLRAAWYARRCALLPAADPPSAPKEIQSGTLQDAQANN